MFKPFNYSKIWRNSCRRKSKKPWRLTNSKVNSTKKNTYLGWASNLCIWTNFSSIQNTSNKKTGCLSHFPALKTSARKSWSGTIDTLRTACLKTHSWTRTNLLPQRFSVRFFLSIKSRVMSSVKPVKPSDTVRNAKPWHFWMNCRKTLEKFMKTKADKLMPLWARCLLMNPSGKRAAHELK